MVHPDEPLKKLLYCAEHEIPHTPYHKPLCDNVPLNVNPTAETVEDNLKGRSPNNDMSFCPFRYRLHFQQTFAHASETEDETIAE
ncbi:MAG: hypothetical protein V3R81_09950, partial [Gammaproteobacteria bacterium]